MSRNSDREARRGEGPARPEGRTWRLAEIGLFLVVLFGASYFRHPVDYDNTQSRFFLLSAIVDFHRLDIDMYKDDTIDVSLSGGRVYSNKAIGAPLVAIPVYWVLRQMTPIRFDKPLSPRARYICTFVTTTLPFAVLGVILFRVLLSMGADPMAAYGSVLAYAFGTIAWIHASMFSGHQMAATFGFISFACVWNASGPSHRSSLGRWFGAGIFAGLGALADYTAISMAALLMVYAVVKAGRPREWLAFAGGGAILAAILFAYNERCFGSPFSFSYAHLGYGDFAEGARRGLLGVALPDPSALLSLLVSPARGIFFIMPVLLPVLPGFWLWFKDRQKGPGSRKGSARYAECGLAAAVGIGYLLINAGFYGWHGGWTFGPRYLVPMLPFLIIPLAFAFERVWMWPLWIVSFIQIGFAQVALPHVPEEIQNPIVECIYPLYRYGYMADNPGLRIGLRGLYSIGPLVGIALLVAWICRPKGIPPAGRDLPIHLSWRPAYALALIAIVGATFAVRSPLQIDIHTYRSRLLGNLAYELQSERLARAAYQEDRLAKQPRR